MLKIIKLIGITLILAGFCGCAGSPSADNANAAMQGDMPEWTLNPSSVYDENRYISAVGYGGDRASSEKDALGALTAIFGQSVQGQTQTGYTYNEATNEENREIDSLITTTFSVDTLIGAEIDDVWFDGNNTYYSIAVMDKFKSSMLYGDLIESNLQTIRTLTESLTGEEKNSFAGYRNFNKAALIADENAACINVLSVLNQASASAYRIESQPADEYRMQARQITRNIPVYITIDQDYAGRIKGVFSEMYSAMGFQTGGENAPYELHISTILEEADLPANPSKFMRYTVNASLVEKSTSQVLFPYNLSGREGSVSVSEAQNRTLRVIEQKVKDTYAAAFQEYMAGM
jgi:hypothetical protein